MIEKLRNKWNIGKYLLCIKYKGRIFNKLIITKIISIGPKEQFFVDSWKINNELAKLSRYSWILDIIDLFNKYMLYCPEENLNAGNSLISIKTFL